MMCVFCQAPLFLVVLHEKLSEGRGYMYDYESDHVINWAHQMAVGLEYIHSKDILHRDIKPSKLGGEGGREGVGREERRGGREGVDKERGVVTLSLIAQLAAV